MEIETGTPAIYKKQLLFFKNKGEKIMNTIEITAATVREPEFYTPGEMATMLRVPLRTLEKWIWQRRLPVVKCGRLNRFPRVEIQKRLLSGNLLK